MNSDFDRGFGIGGLGRQVAKDTLTPRQAERKAQAERETKYCSICGASELDGAMFSTDAGGNVCDDCFG